MPDVAAFIHRGIASAGYPIAMAPSSIETAGLLASSNPTEPLFDWRVLVIPLVVVLGLVLPILLAFRIPIAFLAFKHAAFFTRAQVIRKWLESSRDYIPGRFTMDAFPNITIAISSRWWQRQAQRATAHDDIELETGNASSGIQVLLTLAPGTSIQRTSHSIENRETTDETSSVNELLVIESSYDTAANPSDTLLAHNTGSSTAVETLVKRYVLLPKRRSTTGPAVSGSAANAAKPPMRRSTTPPDI